MYLCVIIKEIVKYKFEMCFIQHFINLPKTNEVQENNQHLYKIKMKITMKVDYCTVVDNWHNILHCTTLW